jgi:hypothetical protein
MRNYIILLISFFVAIQVTGNNLITNSSFESKIRRFKLKTNKPANKVAQTIIVSQKYASKGKSSIKLVLSKATAETALLIHHLDVKTLSRWENFSIKAKLLFEQINPEEPQKLGLSLRIRQWNKQGKYTGNAALTWLNIDTSKKSNLGGSCSVTGKTRIPINDALEFGKWYEFEASGKLNENTVATNFMLSASGTNIIVYVDELMVIEKVVPVFKFVKTPQSITAGASNIALEVQVNPPEKGTQLKGSFIVMKANKVLCKKDIELVAGKQNVILPLKDIESGRIILKTSVYNAANKILHQQKNIINIEADPFAL